MAQVRVWVSVNGRACRALVDTGCSQTIVRSGVVACTEEPKKIIAVDGRIIRCEGEAICDLLVESVLIKVNCLVMKNLVHGIDVILGLDAIGRLHGVCVNEKGARFGICSIASVSKEPLKISDPDFEAEFDGKSWTVSNRDINLINNTERRSSNKIQKQSSGF